MTEGELEQQLKIDGYSQICVHEDQANFEYPDHDHPVDTAYVVLRGNMVVRLNGKEHAVREGDRLDIAKNVVHWARMGEQGCKFLVGVRI